MVRNSGDARDEAEPDDGKALLFLRGQVGAGRILHFVARKGVEHLGDGPLVPERVFHSPVDFAPELPGERNHRKSPRIECLPSD